ncbi:hypothetical protein Tco_0265607 [Tanacetum coccineum]
MRGTSLSRECHPSRNNLVVKDGGYSTSGLTPSCSNCADQVDPGVCARQRCYRILKILPQWDPPRDILVQIHRKKDYEAKIKNRVFNVGDQVLLFNSRLKIFSSKLKSRWSGPFTIVQVFPYGTVELSQNSGPNFKVNGHRLKHYFGGDVPAMDIPDLQTFPKDN